MTVQDRNEEEKYVHLDILGNWKNVITDLGFGQFIHEKSQMSTSGLTALVMCLIPTAGAQRLLALCCSVGSAGVKDEHYSLHGKDRLLQHLGSPCSPSQVLTLSKW